MQLIYMYSHPINFLEYSINHAYTNILLTSELYFQLHVPSLAIKFVIQRLSICSDSLLISF